MHRMFKRPIYIGFGLYKFEFDFLLFWIYLSSNLKTTIKFQSMMIPDSEKLVEDAFDLFGLFFVDRDRAVLATAEIHVVGEFKLAVLRIWQLRIVVNLAHV